MSLLPPSRYFPPAETADEYGLVCIGGDLSPDMLLDAYRHGLFPWPLIEGLDEPQWRPFQLAFVLLNMAGLIDRAHVDRETADLLFFPTGGGKTEASHVFPPIAAALAASHHQIVGNATA